MRTYIELDHSNRLVLTVESEKGVTTPITLPATEGGLRAIVDILKARREPQARTIGTRGAPTSRMTEDLVRELSGRWREAKREERKRKIAEFLEDLDLGDLGL